MAEALTRETVTRRFEAAEVVKDNRVREVRRDAEFFYKLDRRGGHGLRCEFASGRLLAERGVPVVEHLWCGRTPLGTVLVTRALADAPTVREYAREHIPDAKFRDAFADFIRNFLDTGLDHLDMHIGNILYDTRNERFVLVDVRSVRRWRWRRFPYDICRAPLELRRHLGREEICTMLERIGLSDAEAFYDRALRIEAKALHDQWPKRREQVLAGYPKFTRREGELRSRQQAAAEQLKKSQMENTALRSQQTRLVAQMEKQRASSDAAIREKNAALQRLQAELNAHGQQTAEKIPAAVAVELRKQLADQTRRNQELQKENSALRQRRTGLDQEQAKLAGENQSLKNERDSLKLQLAAAAVLSQENSNLKTERDTLKQQLAGQTSRNNALQNERDSLKKQLAGQTSRNDSLRDERDILKLQLADQTSRNTTLQNERDILKKQLAASATGQDEISALKAERDTLKQQLASQASRSNSIQDERDSLKIQLAAAAVLSKENSNLKTERDTLKQQLADVREELASKNRQITSDSQKYAELTEKYRGLELSANETSRKLTESQNRNRQLDKQLADSAEKLAAGGRLNEQERQRLDQAERTMAQQKNDITSMRVRLIQYQEVLAAHEKQRTETLKEISQLQNNLRATAEERNQLVKELENVRKKLPSAEELEIAKTENAKAKRDVARMQEEKNSLENTIAQLQARLGSAQGRLENNQRTIAAYRADVTRLRTALLEFETVRKDLADSRKAVESLRQEKSSILKNAAVMERNLKSELQKSARQLLALRDENSRNRESIDSLSRSSAKLKQDLSRSAAQISDLKKQLAKALSEEEKVKLKKRIASLTDSMRKLASGSEDELVREAASKNVVIDDLLKEQEVSKAEIRKLNKSVESYRILAMRQRALAEKAEAASKIAAYDARKTRGELKMLKADIVDGVVRVPESRRLALSNRKYTPEKEKTPLPRPVKTVKIVSSKPVDTAAAQKVPESSDASAKPAAGSKAPENRVAAAQPAKPVALPKEYLTAMQKGTEAEKSGDLGMALWHFWQAADIAEKRPEPYLALTRLHLKRKEADSALKAYEKAIKNGAKRDPALEKQLNQ